MSVAQRSEQQHLDPAEFVGNWSRRRDFAWSDVERPDDAEAFGLFVLRHRDSGLIDQSNAQLIAAALAPFERCGDVVPLTCIHFAHGWTREVAVRVYRDDERDVPSEAFVVLDGLLARLAAYPILDESDHAARERDAALDGIRVALIGSAVNCNALPDGWEERVYGWLAEHDERQLENTDDTGALPDEEAVIEALTALCLIAPLDA